MAAGVIFNAIRDLTLANQHRTVERIAAVSGATIPAVVASLLANASLLALSDNNASFSYTGDFNAALTTIAASWNGS